MFLKETITASILSTSIALSGAGNAIAESDSRDQSPEQFNTHQIEQESNDYQHALDIMQDFLNLREGTNVYNIFNEIKNNPKQYIRKHKDPTDINNDPQNIDHFFVNLKNKNTKQKSNHWTMQIYVNRSIPNNEIVTFAIALDKNGRIFDGNEEKLGNLFDIQGNVLATVCDGLFNIPEEMKTMTYYGDPPEDENPFYLVKRYTDEDGNYFVQQLTGDNLVILSAPYPLPHEIRKGEEIVRDVMFPQKPTV